MGEHTNRGVIEEIPQLDKPALPREIGGLGAIAELSKDTYPGTIYTDLLYKGTITGHYRSRAST
jgi:hypothetical protein